MKKITLSVLFLFCSFAFAKAQQAFHNFGNVQIHNQGQMGFHIDLINDGDFEDNEGLAGFYSETQELRVSGTNRPIFKDIEVDVVFDLLLDVSMGLTNVIDYLDGRIITPRNDVNVSLDFLNNSLYFGENDDRHTDGYATVTGELDFTFPIGDDFRLRPLTVIPSVSNNTEYKSAYFFEDPNTPSTFISDFNTTSFEPTLSIVSEQEFWDFNGTESTQVTLTWDNQSLVNVLASDIGNLRVVGYSLASETWVDLGNTDVAGSFDEGEITSNTFTPQDYEVITIGSVLKANGSVVVYDIFTPNGDGDNDFLVIGGIEAFPDNELFIYNRWGVEVYSKKGYDNTFDGLSDGRATLKEGGQLPVGTYYYVLTLGGQAEDIAGPIYINR